MRVIGTAGHVDHGKSTLVAALTGIHPDRLKEEQVREMTIELGFAWLTLGDGQEVGIVDVPGHRDFIENMLAGVGGIDAVMLIIAADEGIMPQTREHLAILDLLDIAHGVIALTKVDLVQDEEWLALVENDIQQFLIGTALEQAPIVRVSARTGEGIDNLKETLMSLLAETPPRPNLGRPRLPVDRVFTIAGFGTVVTGTLTDGNFKVGDEVAILPSNKRARIRGLQTHKHKSDTAFPGSRVAINLTGVNVDELRRGDVVVMPGKYSATQRMDVSFRLLRDATQPLQHNEEVKLFIAADETMARVRILGAEQLTPGESGWLQLEMTKPVVAVRGDRYVLRRPSPGETIGGGIVLDPLPRWRHKRQDEAVLTRLQSYLQGTPGQILTQALASGGIQALSAAVTRARLSGEQAQEAIAELVSDGGIIQLEEGAMHPSSDVLVVDPLSWQVETEQAQHELQEYHQSYRLRRGMPKEELKSKLKVSPRVFAALIKRWVSEQVLLDGGTWVASVTHQVIFTPQQQNLVDQLMAQFESSPFAPPSVKECQKMVGDDVYLALVEQERLFQVSEDVVFQKDTYQVLRSWVEDTLKKNGVLTAAEFRDAFSTSRKYALALLEHLDAIGLTVRDGDVRKLRSV